MIRKNIRKIMDEKGWSLERLSEKSGYNSKTILRWTQDKATPNPYALYDLAVSMGVTMERFING